MKYDNILSAPHGFSLRDASAPVLGALGTAAGKVGSLLAHSLSVRASTATKFPSTPKRW